jgi:hypothetical protein
MKTIAYDVGFIEFCEVCGEGEWINLRGSRGRMK